jgi:hypothetical protein
MGWIASHIAGRFAYQFSNDYANTPASTSLNFNGSHSLGWTMKRKPGQVNYALWFKGNESQEPSATGFGNTLFVRCYQGFLHIQLFFTRSGTEHSYYIITSNPVNLTDSVVSYEYTYDDVAKIFTLYRDGVSIPFYNVQGVNYWNNQNDLLTNNPVLDNSNTTNLVLGKALGWEQFEGIIYDAYLYMKCRTSIEVNATYNQVKDTTSLSVQPRILFISDRLAPTLVSSVFSTNDKGDNPVRVTYDAESDIFPRILYSSNSAIHGTKMAFTRLGAGAVVANSNGGNPVTAIPYTVGNILYPCFSFDGSKIGYVRYDPQIGYSRIYTATLNLINNTATSNAQLFADSGTSHVLLDFSPNGTYIVGLRTYNSNNFQEIFRINSSGDVSTIISLIYVNASETVDNVRYNRQGTKIGFSRKVYNGTDYFSQVFIMDADGGNIKQLTGDYINSVFCSFSPDGNNILYSVKPNTGTSQLYTMGVDGRGKVNISGGVQSYSDYQADWYQPVS